MRIVKWTAPAVLMLFVGAMANMPDPGGYQGAKWGMTKNEVRAVFVGQNKKITPSIYWQFKRIYNGLMLKEKIGEYKYFIIFSFDKSDKLDAVLLWPEPEGIMDANYFKTMSRQWPSIFANLKAKYGEPTECQNENRGPFVDQETAIASGTTKVECRWDFEATQILLRMEKEMDALKAPWPFRAFIEYRKTQRGENVNPSTEIQNGL